VFGSGAGGRCEPTKVSRRIRLISHFHSRLGLAFERCSETTEARVRHDRFDASVIEVKREDLMEFMENLHLYM